MQKDFILFFFLFTEKSTLLPIFRDNFIVSLKAFALKEDGIEFGNQEKETNPFLKTFHRVLFSVLPLPDSQRRQHCRAGL